MKIKHINQWWTLTLIVTLLGGMWASFPQAGYSAPTATLTVNSNGDAGDLNPGDGVCDSDAAAGSQCTLRAAIQEANALVGHDTISISLISLLVGSPLPALTDDAGVSIIGNGSSIIDGEIAGDDAIGLRLESDNNIIQGMTLLNFDGYGIRVWWSDNNLIGTDGNGVNDAIEKNHIVLNGEGGIFLMGGINRVAGNHIGVSAPGTSALPNGTGIYIEGALDCGTVIGTNGNGSSGDAAERNLISGNIGHGIYVHNSCVTIAGNIIGLNAPATAALPNSNGIVLDEYATDSLIGTNGDGVSDYTESNIISGNTGAGVLVSFGAQDVTIAGNVFGLNSAGNTAIPNQIGVHVSDSTNIIVGTNDDGTGDYVEGNTISGNSLIGVFLEGAECTQNTVAGNRIGTDSSGDVAVGNQGGIEISSGAHHNVIGDNADGHGDTAERNVISGNSTGVLIQDDTTHDNVVAGNFIGVNYNGDTALPNTNTGVLIMGASDNTIGGQVGNLISGNFIGIFIEGTTATNNTISGNSIGLNAAGSAAIPNQYGVQISAPNNLVGIEGDTDLDGNTISGNSMAGVYLEGSQAHDNIIAGNHIGTDREGEQAIPNYYGISINDAPANRVGTDGDGFGDEDERNVISGNSGLGIRIEDYGADGNVIAGNYIGVNSSGSAALKNGDGDWGEGIYIDLATNTLIGTDADGVADAAERNIISGNNVGGISTSGDGTIVAGNYIGTDLTGLVAIPNGNASLNGDQAVSVSDATARIGANGDGVNDQAERNIISGNYGWGIKVRGSSADTLIAGNYIGVDASGSSAMGNSKSGIGLFSTYGVYVGGLEDGMKNIIAYNDGDGVTIGSDPMSTIETDNLVRGNAIYANAELGIDLGDEGVTPNDPGDADSGPNKLQNFPLLTGASSDPDSTIVVGSLNSQANRTFWLDFYASPNCDASGYGEGRFFLATHTVTTDGSGNASFSAELPVPTSDGYKITATAMDADKGSTSEFSQCVSSISNYVRPTLNIADASLMEPDSGSQDMLFTVSLTSPATTTITVQYATSDGTAIAGSDYQFTAGTLTFSSGEASKTIRVPILGDHEGESSETFTVTLSNPFNAALGKALGTGTILEGVSQVFLPLVIR